MSGENFDKRSESQFANDNQPEGLDWSWSGEAMDEKTQNAEVNKITDEGVSLFDKSKWSKPPF